MHTGLDGDPLSRGSGLNFETLAPSRDDYAMAPIHLAFNWHDSFDTVESGTWYLVVFRSVRSADADDTLLTELDDRAHEEAQASPGFLHYFKGALCSGRMCLSFCLWESPEHGRAASLRPLHASAAQATSIMYDSYRLERYVVRKESGGILSFEALPAHGGRLN
jgi:hypothetical protein